MKGKKLNKTKQKYNNKVNKPTKASLRTGTITAMITMLSSGARWSGVTGQRLDTPAKRECPNVNSHFFALNPRVNYRYFSLYCSFILLHFWACESCLRRGFQTVFFLSDCCNTCHLPVRYNYMWCIIVVVIIMVIVW